VNEEPYAAVPAPQGRARSLLLKIPPPAIYVAVFLAGVGVQQLAPWPWTAAGGPETLEAIGGALIVLGILLAPANALMFLVRGTTLNPNRAPARLFTGGVYRFTRNPMYLGLLLVYTGVALLKAQGWALLLLPVPFLVVDRVYIPCEERHLAQTFGADYRRYCARVRRWLGVRRRS
jgi:protein-S-isoprenylcysteine O-methyltransferase Ste14